jgi:hypothetical protein
LYREVEREDIVSKAREDGSYMKAPNGEPSRLNEEQWVQVRTESFKDWFGDSKVVDENGEPLVVRHVTDAEFNTFDKEHLGANTDLNAADENYAKTAHIGFWFNSGGDLSSAYMERHIDAYLSLKNPMRFGSLSELAEELSGYESAKDFVSEVSRKGHDGVVIRDEEFGGDSYAVFEPNQIKSATDNNGEFSKSNNDIRYREVDDIVPDLESDIINAEDCLRFRKAEEYGRKVGKDAVRQREKERQEELDKELTTPLSFMAENAKWSLDMRHPLKALSAFRNRANRGFIDSRMPLARFIRDVLGLRSNEAARKVNHGDNPYMNAERTPSCSASAHRRSLRCQRPSPTLCATMTAATMQTFL